MDCPLEEIAAPGPLRAMPRRGEPRRPPSHGAAAGRAPQPALVDRVDEMAALHGALDDALAGHGNAVLLGGEPGIGKTRLAIETAAAACARGVPVLWGRGCEDGSSPAFWPWSVGLRHAVVRLGAEQVLAAAGGFRAELARVFPVLLDPTAGPAPDSDVDCARARFRLFDLVRGFLGALAAPEGLLVVLDDVHWADGPSLKLLEFVASELADTRILIVATYRDNEVQGTHPFTATLANLVRERTTRRLPIGGLAPEHCTQWLDAAGIAGDTSTLGAALHRETNGNPLFLSELVHMFATEPGDPGRAAEELSQGLREVILRRLARLGDDCRDVLAVASLFGVSIDDRILCEVIGTQATADHLERARRDGILVKLEDGSARHRFAHAVIRRVAADQLEPSERARWHARIAAVLEQRCVATDVVTTDLVRHFAAAGDVESLHKAFDHACRGAAQAARGLGWEEAVRLLEIALDVGTRCGACDRARAIELQLELARALRGSGDVAAARARCSAIEDACRRARDVQAFTRAVLLHVGPSPQFGRIVPGDRALLEEAYRDVAELPDDLHARLCARLAGDLLAASDVAQAERVHALCEEAVAAARRAGDAGALAMALLGTRYAAALLQRAPQPTRRRATRLPSSEEIVAAAEAGGEHDLAAALRHLRAAGLLMSGARDAFVAEVDALTTVAAASHAPQALWLGDAMDALRATVEGRFAEARQRMDRALAIGRRTEQPNAHGQHASQRIMWYLAQGRLGEIAEEIEVFVASDPGGLGWQPVRALARLANGDVTAARDELHTLLASGLELADSGVMSRCYVAALGMLCAALDDATHAATLYDHVAERKEVWIVDGCQTLGPWALVRGMLARTCGRLDEAARHFADAIEASRRMRAQPFLAHAQVLLVEARVAADPAAARDPEVVALLEAADQSARQLGLEHVVAKVAGLRATPRVVAARPAANVLRRDGEIWTVSFAGHSIHLKDGKGPRYLATLLATPGRDVHVLELAGGAPPARVEAITRRDAAGLSDWSTAIEDAPDARARREYHARLGELRADLEEAEELCDGGRTERLREEMELLLAQVGQCFAGRVRTRGPAETARKAVTKVLRTQIVKLLDGHPALGEHLRTALRMGTFCSYAPATPVAWQIVTESVAEQSRAVTRIAC